MIFQANRIAFFVLVALSLQLTAAVAADSRPNILVIVGDDMGYADLGVHGCKDIPTPHLDTLAAAGVRCTNGYDSAPYCSPTRAGMLTGRYQTRFGHEMNPGGNAKKKKNGQAAATGSTVLITGESGTGKEQIARLIQIASAWTGLVAATALGEMIAAATKHTTT